MLEVDKRLISGDRLRPECDRHTIIQNSSLNHPRILVNHPFCSDTCWSYIARVE